MITYKTLNTRVEWDEIIVFFEFSNGEMQTNRFPLTSTILEIQQWAVDRAKWFDDREIAIAELEHQILEHWAPEELTQ